MRNFVSAPEFIRASMPERRYGNNPSYHPRVAPRRGASDLALQFGLGVLSVRRSWPCADRSVGVGLDGSGVGMATRRRYSRSAGSDVKTEMHRYKRGTAKSGPVGKGGKVKNRKQAIAIGLSKARKKGKKVPARKT
jgi:hypothetical protein